MRGGAISYYEPEQRGRGLGGMLKSTGKFIGRKYVVPYATRMYHSKRKQMENKLKRKVNKMLGGQSGGAFKRRKRRRRQYRDVFRY